jgi:hypothetical protein
MLPRALILRDISMVRRVRRETGEEQVVEVHCDEGGANRVGPRAAHAALFRHMCVFDPRAA